MFKPGDLLRVKPSQVAWIRTIDWSIDIKPWDEMGERITFDPNDVFEFIETKGADNYKLIRVWSPKHNVYISHIGTTMLEKYNGE